MTGHFVFAVCTVFSLLFSVNSFAEEPDYFPLQIGNTWMYRQEYWKFDFDKEDYVKDWEKYITISTIDTITYENKTYYLFDDNNAYRKDGLFVNKYDLNWDWEGLLYDFTPCDDDCTPGEFGRIRYDFNNAFQTCYVARYDIVKDVHAGTFDSFLFTFGCDTHVIYKHHNITPNIGLIYRSDGLYEYYILKEWLVYAKVNGIEYGTTDVEEIPESFLTVENYPNPFNLSTTITFTLPTSGFASLVIYNVMGQEVRELVSESMTPGNHSVIWDGINDNGMPVSSGIFISRLKTGEYTAAGRMLLMK